MQLKNPYKNLRNIIYLENISEETKRNWKKNRKTLHHYLYNGIKSSLSIIFISLGVACIFNIWTQNPFLKRYGFTALDYAIISIIIGFVFIWFIDRIHQQHEMQKDDEYIQYEKKKDEKYLKDREKWTNKNNKLEEKNRKLEQRIDYLSDEISDVKCDTMIDQKVEEKLRKILYDLRFNSTDNTPNNDTNSDKRIELNKRTNEQFIKDITED